jgi:hypothetical protein
MQYPLCAAVMNKHLETRRGHPQSDPVNNLPRVPVYKQWLADKVNPHAVATVNNIEAVQKWFNGSSRFKGNVLDALFSALGLDKYSADPEQRHLMWELRVCAYRPGEINKAWYSAEIDAQRLNLKLNFASEVASHIADPETVAAFAVLHHADVQPAVGQSPYGDVPLPDDAVWLAQHRRAVELLVAADATDLRHALGQQAEPNADVAWPRSPGLGKRVEAEDLVQRFRQATQSQPKAAMKAVVDAVKLVKKSGPSLTADQLSHVCRSATQLFLLFLAEFVVMRDGASPVPTAHTALAFSKTANPLAAALLAEFRYLGGELQFVYPSRRPNGSLLELNHYMTSDDHGISPGFDVPAFKGDFETRALKELRKASGESIDAQSNMVLVRPSLSDAQLAGLVEQLADYEAVHFRFLVDLSKDGSETRLGIALQLNSEIGLPVVAFGAAAAARPGMFDCGSLRPGAGEVDAHLVMLLAALHDLRGQ